MMARLLTSFLESGCWMEEKQKKSDRSGEAETMLELGSWLGRHQAFGLVANRCSAADAECLKAMRDSRQFKKLGLSWAEFCQQKAGVSRRHADRLIGHLEEFGANFFRLADLVPISVETYRLIAGAISGEGIEHEGRRIPLASENRGELVAAVESLRESRSAKAKTQLTADDIRRRMDALLEEVKGLAPAGTERLMLIGVLDEAARKLTGVSHGLKDY
jgi:hypothetical protein